MEVLIDSSFIISCMRKRIDFISQLQEQGFTIKVPREVLQEMKDLHKSDRVSHEDRIAINVAFELIEKLKIKKMSLGNKSVDKGLIEKGREGIYIASLDAGIKKQVPNKIVIFSSKGTVGVA